MTSAVATRPGPQSKCQCHTAKIAYRRGERVRGGQTKAARDTKFENQIFAINKRARLESRDKFQEEARLSLWPSLVLNLSFPSPPPPPSAATAAATGRHVRQRGVLIIFCHDSCFFLHLSLAGPCNTFHLISYFARNCCHLWRRVAQLQMHTHMCGMIYICLYLCACGESQVTT